MDALKKAEQEKKEAAKKRKLAEEDAIHLQESATAGSESEIENESKPLEAEDNTAIDSDSPPPDLSLEPMDKVSATDAVDEIPEHAIADEVPPSDLKTAGPDISDSQMLKAAVDEQAAVDDEFSEGVTIKANTGEFEKRIMSSEQFRSATESTAVKKGDLSLDDARLSSEIAAYEKSMEALPDETSGIADTGEHEKPDLELSGSYPRPALDPDQTFNGLDMEKAFGSESSREIQGSDSSSLDDLDSTYEETLPGISASELANDIGVLDQPTPAAAETIFSATGANAKPSSSLRVAMVVTTIVMFIAAGIVVYNLVTTIDRDIPSPTVARGVETIITSQVVINPVDNADVAPDSTAEDLPVPSTPDETEITVNDSELLATIAEAVETEPTGMTEDVTVTGSINDTEVEQSETPAVPDESFALAEEENYLPEVIEPPPSMVRLTRSQSASVPNRLIQEAYQAYQAGDFIQAEQKYLQAYRELPENRDVLLGMAAIASHKGNDAQAMDIYLNLMRMNPLDPVARAAVLGYQSGENGYATESISAIKSMVYEYPEQPVLYFNLGKLYANRSSWAEAQQAFFDAFRLDSENPDYALNLAVSLDRLGQKNAALDYYNTAVNLAGNSPAGFETEKVLSRIRTLTSGY